MRKYVLLGLIAMTPIFVRADVTRLSVPRWGTAIEVDPRLQFLPPQPNDLPIVKDGQKSLKDLIADGEKLWRTLTWGQEDFLFGFPAEVYDSFFVNKDGSFRSTLFHFLEYFRPSGIPYLPGDSLPAGLTRITKDSGQQLIVTNCAACHSGRVNGKYIPGVGNKWFSEDSMLSAARLALKMGQKVLNRKEIKENALLAEEVRTQLKNLERVDLIMDKGNCSNSGHGRLASKRIWQLASGALDDYHLLETEEGQKKFPCGPSKTPALNTLKYQGLYFWDGAVNAQFSNHIPIYDLLTIEQRGHWPDLSRTPEVQAFTAFANFGLEIPTWETVMETAPNVEKAKRGFDVFHRVNSCASCHGSYSPLGQLRTFRPRVFSLKKIGTDPDRAKAAFHETLAHFGQSNGTMFVPKLTDSMKSDYPDGYRVSPLCGTYLNFPYLHTGAVGNLWELLKPADERSLSFWLSNLVDKKNVGFYTGTLTRWLRERAELKANRMLLRKFKRSEVAGHSGPEFGTELSASEKTDLVEFLKTLSCEPGEPLENFNSK